MWVAVSSCKRVAVGVHMCIGVHKPKKLTFQTTISGKVMPKALPRSRTTEAMLKTELLLAVSNHEPDRYQKPVGG